MIILGIAYMGLELSVVDNDSDSGRVTIKEEVLQRVTGHKSDTDDLVAVKDSIILEETAKVSLINAEGQTVQERFQVPEGYERIQSELDSFGHYLQTLQLKANGSKVSYYDGRIKNKDNVYAAVVDMDIGEKDLQQCADAVMRLRGEYLYLNGQADEIHFNLTNGFLVDFDRWSRGSRVKVEGNTTTWVNSGIASDSYESFLNYMEFVFIYAGSLSLSQELIEIEWVDVRIGDVLIVGGSPGHAVIVVDMAIEKESGEKLFMLAQSYMPAQDIQILVNRNEELLSPWYKLSGENDVKTPEWTFSSDQWMRFE